MTIDSFNKSGNIIVRAMDQMQGQVPIHLIRAARPILILDEPQNYESETSKAALASLHPLLALRYSATHRVPYNVVYRLTPYQAYRQGLVKRIRVDSVVTEGDQARPFVRLESVNARGGSATAKLRKERLLSPEFKELWERIRHKTLYSVQVDTQRLLAEAVPAVDRAEPPPFGRARGFACYAAGCWAS